MIGSGRNARLHQRDHLPDGRGARPQGERADPVRPSRDRMQRRDALEADAGRRGRTARPRVAALRGEQARHARGAERAPRRTARPCWSRRAAATAAALARQASTRSPPSSPASRLFTPLRFATDPAEATALWNVRKGMFPAVGAMRRPGTTVIIEDVAFPDRAARRSDARPADACSSEHGYHEAIIFGHALEGNLHFVFTQDFGNAAEIEALPPVHGRDVRDGRSRNTTAR